MPSVGGVFAYVPATLVRAQQSSRSHLGYTIDNRYRSDVQHIALESFEVFICQYWEMLIEGKAMLREW